MLKHSKCILFEMKCQVFEIQLENEFYKNWQVWTFLNSSYILANFETMTFLEISYFLIKDWTISRYQEGAIGATMISSMSTLIFTGLFIPNWLSWFSKLNPELCGVIKKKRSDFLFVWIKFLFMDISSH